MAKSIYSGVDFYAERGGTIVCVSRTIKNGTCFAGVGVPAGNKRATPVCTWVSPVYLTKCVKVTEDEARAIHPALLHYLERFDHDAAFRSTHARRAARSPLQPAF